MQISPSLARWARAHHQLVTRSAWVTTGHEPRGFDRPIERGEVRAVVCRGIPTTNPLRTLVDLGATDGASVPGALEAFTISRLVSPAAVRSARARRRRPGRDGVDALESALASSVLGAKPPDSVLEPLTGALLGQHGLEGWHFHPRVYRIEVDFGFAATKVAIEVDRWTYHRTRQQFENDRARDAKLASRGRVVLRFTWRQVTREPSRVARVIRATLDSRA